MKNKTRPGELGRDVGKVLGDAESLVIIEVRHWPALVALLLVSLVITVVFTMLTQRFVVGLGTLIFGGFVALIIPALIFGSRGNHQMKHNILVVVGLLLLLVETVTIGLLLWTLPDHTMPGIVLLVSAGLLWLCNIGVFALWFWQIEGGGPYARSRESAVAYHKRAELLFPQLGLIDQRPELVHWRPDFIDYLFVAFNTSTAFSPTDTAILSTRLKIVSMAQSLLSLVTVATLAARAVNML